MLERLSASVDGARQKTAKAVSDRLHVFGGRKQVPFHIVISELRAELITNKQYASGQPCVLKWVRGDTVHVSEDSIGQTVHSWSDTYFAQVVSLQLSGSSFRPKACKFKVQQKLKTIAKTATLDLTKYCSEIGLARDQKVALPLQPSGTLFFVISTAPASDQQQRGSDAPSPESSATSLMRVSHNPSVGVERDSGRAASIADVSGGGALSLSTETSRHLTDGLQSAGGRAAASASSIGGMVISHGLGKGRGAIETTETSASTPDEGERVSTSGRGHQRKPSGGTPAGWVAGFAAAVTTGVKGSPSTPKAQGTDGIDEKGQGTGVFKRKGRGNDGKTTTAFATAAGAVAASGAAMASAISATPGGLVPLLNHRSVLRKSDSDNIIGGAASVLNLRSSFDIQAERHLTVLAAPAAGRGGKRGGASGSGFVAASQHANRSFTGTPPASRGAGPQSSPLQFQLLPSALEGVRSLARRSGAPSTCSDTAASTVKAAAACVSAAVEGAAHPSGGGSGAGGGWGNWLRSGWAWGRSSNQSATGMSTGPISYPSLPNGGSAVEQELSPLEVAIMGATEEAELRELALDLMHERDEWRARALEAQDALGRAQASRGSAVREAQRLELRLRQYQDELGRRTDGSLLKELVEAKVRIAELANENIKLRRQITHMGPLFYDDSGDEVCRN